MKRGLVFVFLILFLVGSVSAADYYVWGGVGSDSNNGSAMDVDHAWATLNHADDVVGPEDIVHLKGTFLNQQYLNNANAGNGIEGYPVIYRPYEDSYVNFMGDGAGILFVNKNHVIMDGFFGSNKRFRTYGGDGSGIRIDGANNIIITGFLINPLGETGHSASGLKIRQTSKYIYIHDNVFRPGSSGSNRECLYIGSYQQDYDIDHVYVYNNEFTATDVTNEPQAIDNKAYNGNNIEIYNNKITSFLTEGYAPISLSGAGEKIYNNTIDISGQNSVSKNAFFYYFYSSGYTPAIAVSYIYGNTLIGGSGDEAIALFVGSWPGLEINLYNNIVKNINYNRGNILDFDRGGYKELGKANIYHNTFFNCESDGFLNANNCLIEINAKNNLFNDWGLYAFTDTSGMTSTWNGNYYYKSGVSVNDNVFTWNNVEKSFNDIQSLGQETYGTFGVNPNLDINGKLTAPIQVKDDVSSEMSGWPDYDKDIDGKTRTGIWDIGAYEYVSSPTQNCSELSGSCCTTGQTCSGTMQTASDCSTCCVGGTCLSPSNFLPDEIVEAEDGNILSPMAIYSDSSASGGEYVYSDTDGSGSVAFSFDIPTAGDYLIEARILTDSGAHNSFYVGVDGEAANGDEYYTWDTDIFTSFNWENVSLRGTGGSYNTSDYDPMVWGLSSGSHVFTFYGREADSGLDSIVLKSLVLSSCSSGADSDEDSSVSISELLDFISAWKLGSVSIGELIDGISEWKSGC